MVSKTAILLWLLRKAGIAAKHRLIDIVTDPVAAARDLWEWIKTHKLVCFCILMGILTIAVPPLIGFSAAGPVAGSLAAAWQAGIGSVAAGSIFAIIQSLTMTGVMSAIGGGLIGAGIAWSVATCDWIAIAGGAITEFAKKHAAVFRGSLGTVQELERVLHRVDNVALIMAEDEQSRIRAGMAELRQQLDAMAAIQRLFQVIQNLDGAVSRDASVGEVQELVAELQAACEAFCAPEGQALRATASLEEQWAEYRERAVIKCRELWGTLGVASLEGTWAGTRCVRRLLVELDRMADELLVLELSAAEN